ncbi:MAG TPA: hypothetical protein VIF62_35205 [Labilithrix sp.]|jgi:hypothetical protein
MKLVKITTSVIVLGAIGAMVACSAAAPPASTDDNNNDTVGSGVPAGPEGGASSSSSGGANPPSAGPTCGSDDFVKADLSTLTACNSGKGHCYDKTKVPLADQMVACADASQVCVPDDILESNGAKPKSCTSIVGPGGCATTGFMPSLDMQAAGFLKQDVCDAGQLCVPCNDPTNGNAPTPFCQPIGVHKNACGPTSGSDAGADAAPTTLPACCSHKGAASHGVCLPDSAIPAAQASSTTQQECATGNKCVPAAFVANKPVACDAGFLGSGVCMDTCFDSTLGLAGDIGLLDGTGCDQNELCIPCSFVSGQGVPGCGP